MKKLMKFQKGNTQLVTETMIWKTVMHVYIAKILEKKQVPVQKQVLLWLCECNIQRAHRQNLQGNKKLQGMYEVLDNVTT